MTEEHAFPLWTDVWVEAQRTYWDTWFVSAQQILQDTSPKERQKTGNPWVDALGAWWEAVAPAVRLPAREFFGALAEHRKIFLRAQSDGRRAMGGALAFWGLPLDTWRRTASSASVLPGDFLESLRAEGGEAADRFRERMDRFLSTPSLGYTREWQEQGQELARLGLDYQRALQDYNYLAIKLALDILARLYRKLMAPAAQGQAITSLRELYDLWVDCSEELYMELVHTEQYAEVYGRLVNALMALKRHGGDMVDEMLGALGMPTRKGLNTMQRRQQELRRELVAFRRELDAAELVELRAELNAVRQELSGLRASVPSVRASASSEPPRRTRSRTERKGD